MPKARRGRLGVGFSGAPRAPRALAFWLLLLIGAWQPLPEAVAQTTAPVPAAPITAAPNTAPANPASRVATPANTAPQASVPHPACAPSPVSPLPRAGVPCPPPKPAGPEVWGTIGFDGFFTGLRQAPNGLSYDPLLSLYSDVNFGLLPNKQLYLFLNNDFWVQRDSTRFSGVSQREFDAQYGVAWNYWDSLEFRVFGFADNNLNRGNSRLAPEGYTDGWGLENRYYFNYPDIYDVNRLGYISLGYYPSQSLVGNNGQSFKPGLFARGYLTESLPTPFTSYVYGGLGIVAENVADPRLFTGDFGVAVRPVAAMQNLEFRVGDAFRDDLKAGLTWNYIYAGVRLGFEGGPSSAAGSGSSPALAWPDVWGDIGLPFYIDSSHMAPNGVPFAPIAAVTSDLNLGLLPQKKLYLFWDGDFWLQHADTITRNGQDSATFSKREIDSNLGLAWNYFGSLELRGSVYALNNLNRGISNAVPSGGNEGVILENRYNFAGADPYDIGRLNYLGFGYIPTDTLVGDNGASFRPGPFAHAYLTRDLPIPWFRSYVYAGMQIIAEHTALPRLFDADVGWAVRPFAHWQNLELRIGDDVSQDVVAAANRNLIYGAIRLNFAPGGFGPFAH
jgi:hypothetical protein